MKIYFAAMRVYSHLQEIKYTVTQKNTRHTKIFSAFVAEINSYTLMYQRKVVQLRHFKAFRSQISFFFNHCEGLNMAEM